MLTKSCYNNYSADILNSGSLFKHNNINYFNLLLIVSGIKGISLLYPIVNIAYIGLFKSYYNHGNLPVAISKIVQPKDHISAFYVYLVYFITSGAIQGTEPIL